MRFLVDAQLPPALAAWLRSQGLDAEHVEDVGLRNAEDLPIWKYAQSAGAIILSKDEDFAERVMRDPQGPSVVWLRIGNTTNRALLEWLESRWPNIVSLLSLDHRLVEVR